METQHHTPTDYPAFFVSRLYVGTAADFPHAAVRLHPRKVGVFAECGMVHGIRPMSRIIVRRKCFDSLPEDDRAALTNWAASFNFFDIVDENENI